jgi:hypothetical protein
MEMIDLVGVISACVCDINKVEVKVKFGPSEAVEMHVEGLEAVREELLLAQKERGLDFAW